MGKFKKIYIEITNVCNLKCSFCSLSKRKKKEMSVEEFSIVISKIKPYTKYIFLHIKGEPLLHNHLDEIIAICDRENIFVNITTNGTLLKKNTELLERHPSIRQINVSMHSENGDDNYCEEVFQTCKYLSNKMYISYRLWTLSDMKLDEKSTEIVDKISNYYQLSTEIVEKLKKEKQIKIDSNTYVNKDNMFIWPEGETPFEFHGHCHALKTHIGILSDGTVVPCCLDGDGVINLGNILVDKLENILISSRYKNMKEGFKNNKSVEALCKSCTFRERFLHK